MTPTAILMMLLAILIVWGGLLASVVHLRRRPELEGLVDPDELSDDELDRGELEDHQHAHARRDL